MDAEKIGSLILTRRRELGLTQRELAQLLLVSDKAVSKWERGQGCPDISLFPPLSRVLELDMDALLSGERTENRFLEGNMKKTSYYVCPVCGNLVLAAGSAQISCCGRRLEPLTPQKPDEAHRLSVEQVEDDWFLTSEHPMTKEHYLSFVALAAGDRLTLVKTYPEWELQVRLPRRVHGILLWYCTGHGLFRQPL